MKKLFIIIFLTGFCSILTAQNQLLSTTNKKAIKIYREAMIAVSTGGDISQDEFIKKMQQAIKIDKNFTEAYWKIADVKSSKAQELLETLIAINAPRKDETLLKLAEVYYKSQKYDKAHNTILQMSDDIKFTEQKNKLSERYLIIYNLSKDTVPFVPKNLEHLNTDFDEYFPSITADEKMMSVTRSIQGDRSTQEDLFYSTNLNGTWLPLLPITELNSPYNEGSQSFSADGRYMFFVECQYVDNIGGCDIFYSINTNGSWSKPIHAPRPVNWEGWQSNPMLSPAGNELFFVSSRKPNFGGKDIWVCDVKILDGGLLAFSNARNI